MNEVTAGFVTLPGGMNAGTNPLLVEDTQCARAINVVFRSGLARTRPAFERLCATEIPSGVFLGLGRWSLEEREYIVFVVDGEVYALELQAMQMIQVMSGPMSVAFDSRSATCYFTQVHKYMVIQNGLESPIVLQESGGVISRVLKITVDDEDGDNIDELLDVSIPIGTLGVFAHGRLHMVPRVIPNTTESGRTSLVSGDIMLPENPQTALRFSETEYLAEGGAHSLPLELGYIGGLGVLRNAMTGTGQGNIVVLARTGSCAFDFSISRDEWKTQAISSVLFQGPGCRSPRAVVSVNNDLVYRGVDGLRTLKYTVSQKAGNSGALSDTPLSSAVDPFLDGDEPGLHMVSAACYDNRLLFTAGYEAGTNSFRGLVSWDVYASSVFDGLWTGALFLQVTEALIGNEPSLLAMAGGNRLYRLAKKADEGYDPGGTPIEARIETKAYTFGDLVTVKKLQHADLWLSDVWCTTEVEVFYRPHGYPLWKSMGVRTVEVVPGGLSQSSPRLRFSVDFSGENCNPTTGEPLYVATAFEFSIKWTGRAVLERFRAVALQDTEPPPDMCETRPGVLLEASAAAGEQLFDVGYMFREES